jgi:hypothetical protein
MAIFICLSVVIVSELNKLTVCCELVVFRAHEVYQPFPSIVLIAIKRDLKRVEMLSDLLFVSDHSAFLL